MTAIVVQADARALPLPDESVDLVVMSPPYWAQRSYRDGGEHYDGQIGSEPHPQEFLEALWAVLGECWRVLKPQGVVFVNLGDKRAGSGGHNNAGISGPSPRSTLQNPHYGRRMAADAIGATRRNAPDRYLQTHFGRRKSKQLLPARFAIGCQDGQADPEGKGWIVSDYIWHKLNGLPESVTDRCRDSHEYVFQLTKSERWFAAVDEVRVPTLGRAGLTWEQRKALDNGGNTKARYSDQNGHGGSAGMADHPLGALPPSVWPMASEPLLIPEWAKERLDLPDHFAAFPTELARRCILGWSPVGGVVLDPFGGTGTTAMVARSLGRVGVSADLSHDYCRLARWRIWESGHGAKAVRRTNEEAQAALL